MNIIMNEATVQQKVRFDVLKRDGFHCQYCGKTANETTLEIDHIVPRSKNGTNDKENLITSCKECNKGKFIDIISLPMFSDDYIPKGFIYELGDVIYDTYYAIIKTRRICSNSSYNNDSKEKRMITTLLRVKDKKTIKLTYCKCSRCGCEFWQPHHHYIEAVISCMICNNPLYPTKICEITVDNPKSLYSTG